MSRRWKNIRGRRRGFGGCGRCGNTWDWAFETAHYTEYEDGSACFPLCDPCWEDLGSPVARMPYYEDLMRKWDSVPAAKIQAVYQAVLEGK